MICSQVGFQKFPLLKVLIFSQGIYQEDSGYFSGACRGDDGGPLTVEADGQTTLVGIVSGGLGCGNGIPNWYTRVSFYEEWMACILEKSRVLKSSDQVITEDNPFDKTPQFAG